MQLPKNIITLSKIFNEHNYQLYPVGGCVRDFILNKIPHDYDLCTDATPSEMIDMFQYNKKIKLKLNSVEFGTVTIIIDNEPYEITTFRSDGTYDDNRHPDNITFEKTIEADLLRRDFTINAIAYDIQSKNYIYTKYGDEDIHNKIIRCVGDPNERFKEDALRIIRALRFALTLNFNIEENTWKVMLSNLDLIKNISKERITMELEKMLTCGKPISYWFNKGHEIIFTMIPELKPCYKFWQNNKYHKHDVYEHILTVVDACDTDSFIIKLAALYHDIGKPNAYIEDENGYGHFYGHPKISEEIFKTSAKQNLRLTAYENEECDALILYHDIDIIPTKKYVHKLIVNHGITFVRDFIVLKRADISDHIYPDNAKPLWCYIDEFENIFNELLEEESVFSLKDLAINGNDLMQEFGLKPGKTIGFILKSLLASVVDTTLNNDRAELLTAAKALI